MKNGFWKRTAFVLTLCLSIVAAVGVIDRIDNRYAKSAKLELVSQRLDQKILQDKIDWLQNKIQELLDKYGSEINMPPDVRGWYRDLCRQLENAKRRLERL